MINVDFFGVEFRNKTPSWYSCRVVLVYGFSCVYIFFFFFYLTIFIRLDTWIELGDGNRINSYIKRFRALASETRRHGHGYPTAAVDNRAAAIQK